MLDILDKFGLDERHIPRHTVMKVDEKKNEANCSHKEEKVICSKEISDCIDMANLDLTQN